MKYVCVSRYVLVSVLLCRPVCLCPSGSLSAVACACVWRCLKACVLVCACVHACSVCLGVCVCVMCVHACDSALHVSACVLPACAYVRAYVCTCGCLCERMDVWVRVHACACVCMHERANMCLCMHDCILCLSPGAQMHVRVSLTSANACA